MMEFCCSAMALLVELNRLLGESEDCEKVASAKASSVVFSSPSSENIKSRVVSKNWALGVVDNMEANSLIKASSSSLQSNPDSEKRRMILASNTI